MNKLTVLPILFGIGFLVALFTEFTSPRNITNTAIAAPTANLDLTLDLVTGGLDKPTAVTHTPLPNDGRLFITQQGGQIRIVDDTDTLLPGDFLNISSKVHLFGENGLLGLAFDSDYANNGRFYVYYTNKFDKNNYLARYQVTADANIADPTSEVILMTINQPKDGHNGGSLVFGPDGYLYISVGDGGLEPEDNPTTKPQDLTSLLGKILRIDPSQGTGSPPDCGSAHYTIPATNPFVDGNGSSCDEVWAYGLRNPWRISFDKLTGDLFIADVGERNWEEINWQQFGSGGQNYGWPCYEGEAVYHAGSCMQTVDAYTFPIFTYSHATDNNCSITGGAIYRGQRFPVMWGHYLLADFCSGNLWSLNQTASGWQNEYYGTQTAFPTTFGENYQGEIFVAELNSGNLYHISENTEVVTLAITKSGLTESAANAPIQYDLTIQNQSESAATNLTITDTLPFGATYISGGSLNNGVVSWQIPTLAGNSSSTVSFIVTATETILNDDYGVVADGGVYAQGTTAVTTTILTPKLTLHKTAPPIAEPGTPITYALTIQNNGTLTATNISLTDTLPISTTFVTASDSGLPADNIVTWNLAPLPPQSEKTVTLTVQPINPGEEPLTIANISYGVTADGGIEENGSPVYTFINGKTVFMPIIQKAP